MSVTGKSMSREALTSFLDFCRPGQLPYQEFASRRKGPSLVLGCNLRFTQPTYIANKALGEILCIYWQLKTTLRWPSRSPRGLREEAYEVDVARDGASALEITRKRSFDIVLLDLMLAGLSGLDVGRQLP